MLNVQGCSPTITVSLDVPFEMTWSFVNPYSGEVTRLKAFFSQTHSLISIQVEDAQWPLLLAIRAIITRALACGWWTHLASASIKTMSLSSLRVCLSGCSSVLYICIRGGALVSFAYLSHSLQLSPARWDPPIMVSTSWTFFELPAEVVPLYSPLEARPQNP